MGSSCTDAKRFTVRIQKRDHLFKPGQSGNPKGRPKGALNKTTRAARVLLENEAADLTRKLVELGKGGDLTALRLSRGERRAGAMLTHGMVLTARPFDL
jgi:hypothetical protein